MAFLIHFLVQQEILFVFSVIAFIRMIFAVFSLFADQTILPHDPLDPFMIDAGQLFLFGQNDASESISGLMMLELRLNDPQDPGIFFLMPSHDLQMLV